MKRTSKKKSNTTDVEQMMDKALLSGGFMFPKTVEEVKDFERIHGSTDVILPIELQEPTFLYAPPQKRGSSKVIQFTPENFAMAAREGSAQLPDDVEKQIINDIKAFKAKKTKKK